MYEFIEGSKHSNPLTPYPLIYQWLRTPAPRQIRTFTGSNPPKSSKSAMQHTNVGTAPGMMPSSRSSTIPAFAAARSHKSTATCSTSSTANSEYLVPSKRTTPTTTHQTPSPSPSTAQASYAPFEPCAYLNTREDDSPALFPSRKSDQMTGKGINDVVKRTARRAEIAPFTYSGRGDSEDVTAHTLRHSVAWRMLRAEEGNTLYDVRNRLRHATIPTTERRYDHFQTV